MKKPSWLRVKLPSGRQVALIKELKNRKSLHTVCEEALCPNMAHCWEKGHATFLILGDVCTRDCRFCAVKSGIPLKTERREPGHVAEAALAMGLRHVVLTSVTRDDLPDGGAFIFAETIRQLRKQIPGSTVEVLVPDFQGEKRALDMVLKAAPHIVGHNLETVPRLYSEVRPQAGYRRSLNLIRTVKGLFPGAITKSGVMVGLGETADELIEVMDDLRQADCDIFTLGQYLSPSKNHLPVARYYTPDEFNELKDKAYALGFRWVESGPLVRSSYGADAQAEVLLADWPS